MLEENLKTLAEELELPPFSFDQKTSCFHLPLAEDLTVHIQHFNPGCGFFAKVAPAPEIKQEDAFIHFMKANLLGQGTGQQFLGLDQEEKFLTLSCKIPYDMDYREFKERIEDFVNYLDYWRLETEKLQQAAQDSIL